MPRFKKGSQEAKEWGAMMKAKRGSTKSGGKFNLLKTLTDVGTKAGEPFKATTGVNPFTLGYDLGHDVIAPALLGRGGLPTSMVRKPLGSDPATYTPARFRAGGSVGAYEQTIAQQGNQRFGNTNNGVMRVPFASTPYQIHIAGISGRNGVPEKTGRGVIDQTFNSGGVAQSYNQSNLGANGIVRIK